MTANDLKNTEKQSEPHNILIIKPSALGDIALALPALASLRASFPKARISWFIRPEFAPLLKNVPGVDEMVIFDRKLLGKWWYRPKSFAALIKLTKRLRSEKYDIAIDLQGLFRTAFFTWLTGCKKRFGMANAREYAVVFYNHRVPVKDCIHVIDYYQKIVAAAGASQKVMDFNLEPDAKSKETVARLLAGHGTKPDNYAVFVPGSAHKHKCWPAENFAALAEKIASKYDMSIAAVGTNSEKSIIDELKAQSKEPVIDLAGCTDIPQLVALLNGAKLVVSNDTGPGHIAAALKKPVVLIFGPTNPARISPYGRPETVAAIDIEKRGTDIENKSYRIEDVSVEHVFEKVNLQLK